MKRMITMMLTVMMVMSFGMNVKAEETVSKTLIENRVRREVSYYEYTMAEALDEEQEALARALEYNVTSKKLNENGIYDICLEFVFYKKYHYEYHYIFDAVEDYTEIEYGIDTYGYRRDTDEIDEIIINKFPELGLK